ncbi:MULTISPECIES: glycosyltransferase [unclassified Adlercreutzia]|uniref:glycosyltransferase family 2 protein n=1 Tax=unclassified Adlercreutzia TaxID=2636013 RepID=UPI0013ED4421|nr:MULTISPECIES: glycosyltransferase [unclassified Adlercreutzia]
MKPEVSVICITYNQVDYIQDALDGFVNQETDFSYEVIVHDDASTDGTADVVCEYAERYPNLIMPILQTKNQLSLGKGGIRDYALPAARGRFVALCEGDDYWISAKKLQVQHDLMASNPGVSLCVHNALVVDYGHNCLFLSESSSGNRMKSMEDVVIEGGGRINPTASMFFRKELLGEGFAGAPVGDHFYLMDLASKGDVAWIAEPMSVYRLMSRGSWSVRHSGIDAKAQEGYCRAYVGALDQVESRNPGKYTTSIQARKKFQLDLLGEEVLTALFAGGAIRLPRLFKEATSGKTIAKAMTRRYLPPNAQRFVGRAYAIRNAKRAGTLVSRSTKDLPDWALPLSGKGAGKA